MTRIRRPGCLLLLGMPLLIPVAWVVVSLTAKPLYRGAAEVPTAASGTPGARWAEAMAKGRAAVRESVARQNVPGVSVAIGVGGELVWAEGFGYADLFRAVPMTPEHRLRMGSASEMLTSAAAGVLLESGGLKLDAEIQQYVPQYPRQAWRMRLREVMGHTAGLAPEGKEGPLFTTHCDGSADALRKAGDARPQFEPGTKFRPSRYGWMLVSAAVGSAAGQPFAAFVRDRVLAPLEMRETVPDPSWIDPEGDDFPLFVLIREKIYDAEAQVGVRRAAAGTGASYYFPRFAKDPRYGFHVMRPMDLSCYSGASGFLSTPSDLVHFAMAMQGGKLVQPATVESLQAPLRLASGESTGFGLGWEAGTVTVSGRPARSIGRDGELLGGRVVSVLTLPDAGLTVAVMSNTAHADTRSIALSVAGAFAARGTEGR